MTQTIKPLSWSFSRIDAHKTCPKKFWHISIRKDVPFEQTAAMKQGEIQHKMLEDYVSKGTPMPTGYEFLATVGDSFRNARGTKFTEFQMALTEDRRPCGYKDWDNAWVRGIIDVMVMDGPSAFVADYKTGNPTFDEMQLKLFAVMLFAHFPEIHTVTTAYIWLKTKTIDKCTYTRSQEAELWAAILPDVDALQESNRLDYWPAKPNKFCAWCPVNRKGMCDKANAKPRW
jgi:hypothetical protein